MQYHSLLIQAHRAFQKFQIDNRNAALVTTSVVMIGVVHICSTTNLLSHIGFHVHIPGSHREYNYLLLFCLWSFTFGVE